METQISKQLDFETELTWIALTKNGNRAAFNGIVTQYRRPIFSLCYRMLNDELEAEDAVQEVFSRAYFKLDTYNESHKFSTWLFSIATHYCLDRLRMRRPGLIAWADLPFWYEALDEEITQPEIKQEARKEVNDLIQFLPSEYRTLVILKYWHDLSYEEMAQMLETTVSGVKSKLFRASPFVLI